jgi:uncharacterized membrane protein YraQ (UPF0718 family)
MSKDKKKFSFKGVKFFVIVLVIYIILAILNVDLAVVSLQKAFSTLLKILSILVIVIFVTAIINYLLNPKDLANHLSDKGLKGWLIALMAGILSHGPMYAWYPLLANLREHGVKSGLIATFLYARAVKLPMLPLMVLYFGMAFTIVLSLLILTFSVIQGVIINRVLR